MPDNRSEAFSSVLVALRDRAELLASAEADPLALVEESARLHALADELIAAGVDVARGTGIGAGELTARITFDGDARVAGLFFLDPEYARHH